MHKQVYLGATNRRLMSQYARQWCPAHPQKGKVSEVCHTDKEHDQMLRLVVSSLHSTLHSIPSYQHLNTWGQSEILALHPQHELIYLLFVCNIESHSCHRTKWERVCVFLSWKRKADESISSLSSLHHNQSHCVTAENGTNNQSAACSHIFFVVSDGKVSSVFSRNSV